MKNIENKEISSVHIQFKITPSEYVPYDNILVATGMTRAALFKMIVLNKEVVLKLGNEGKEERDRLVFLSNKASNNINQIAKNVNQAYRGGVINESLYVQTLNNLISLEKLFSGAIDKC